MLIALAFLCGSVPFGVIVARRAGVRIQEHGSGNIGASNVARTLGLVPGLVVLLLDATKGAAPTMIAIDRGCAPWFVVCVAFAAVLGHCFSPFLGGKGGKGVATAFGALLVLAPGVALLAAGVFAALLALTRVPALGSLGGIALTAAVLAIRGDAPCAAFAAATFALLLYTHRSNIARLTRSRRSP